MGSSGIVLYWPMGSQGRIVPIISCVRILDQE